MRRLSVKPLEAGQKERPKYPEKSLPDTERMGETRAELPLYRGSGRLLKPRPGRPQRTCINGRPSPADEPGHGGASIRPVGHPSPCGGPLPSCLRAKASLSRPRASMPKQEVSGEDPQEPPAEAEADPQPELQREPEPLRPAPGCPCHS